MSSFLRNRKKNFGFHRKIILLKRLRESRFEHITKKKKSRKNRQKSWSEVIPTSKYRWIYNQKPIISKKDNQKTITGSGLGGGRHFCTDCNHSQHSMNSKCTRCGSEKILRLSNNVRVPRKTTNKQKWKNFRKAFIEPYLYIFVK